MLGHEARGNSFFLGYNSYMLFEAESVCFICGNLLDDFLMRHDAPSAKTGKLASSLFQTVALSWFRKASLYEQLKPSINFQSVESMPVHTTLSASLLQVVASCLPSIKTLSNEAQNCSLFLALLVCFTSSYLEILLI